MVLVTFLESGTQGFETGILYLFGFHINFKLFQESLGPYCIELCLVIDVRNVSVTILVLKEVLVENLHQL